MNKTTAILFALIGVIASAPPARVYTGKFRELKIMSSPDMDSLAFDKDGREYHPRHERITILQQQERFSDGTNSWHTVPFVTVNTDDKNFTDESIRDMPYDDNQTN